MSKPTPLSHRRLYDYSFHHFKFFDCRFFILILTIYILTMKPFQDIKAPRKATAKPGRFSDLKNDVVDIKKNHELAKEAFWTSRQKIEKEPAPPIAITVPLTKQHSVKVSGDRKVPRAFLWSIAAVALIFLFFSFSGLFAGAVVKITPARVHSIIDGQFNAYKETKDGELQYDVVILSGQASVDVPATEERNVERKAFGQIIVYNTYSSAPQRLITNTRFSASDGKIYRVKDSVVVPGTTMNGSETIPGSVEATIYADEPGEKYNIGLVDFTIPGFKGDPRYEKFYARSKTEMKGGFSGTMKFPSDAEIKIAEDGLKEKVRGQIISDARAQTPSGFILYDDGIFITFDDGDVPEASGGSAVTITQRGTLHGIIFERKALAQFIARKSVASFDGGDIEIRNLDQITFAVVDRENSKPLDGEIVAVFSGSVDAMWVLDEEGLKKNLINVRKSDFQKAISGFPHIERAEASLRPFWKRNFPDDANRIRVEQVIQ